MFGGYAINNIHDDGLPFTYNYFPRTVVQRALQQKVNMFSVWYVASNVALFVREG